MYEHHKQSIENLVKHFEGDGEIISVILAGSIAHKLERPDSDVDAIVVVTEKRYAEREKANSLTECIYGECTYEGGYFDIKYCTVEYLKAAAEYGSEPSRHAMLDAYCLFSRDDRIPALVAQIPVFQKQEKDEKMLSFFSAFMLSVGYFWAMSGDNLYLRYRAATDIVLFGLRMILEENEILFPCHKALVATVAAMEKETGAVLEKCDAFLRTMTDEAKNEFVAAVLAFLDFERPSDHAKILTAYTADNELWWYKTRPVIAEW